MGACCIQDVIEVLNTEDDKSQFIDSIETWNCVLGKYMNNLMFDLIR